MPLIARLRNPGTVALLLGGLGVLYRVALLLLGSPWVNNSDESTMGLMALHISRGEDFPVYIYGQHYMGATAAYMATPLFWLFGPSTLALRVPTLLFYVAFCWLMYELVSRLYTPWFAAAMTGLFALGGSRVIAGQLLGSGGYPELLPASAGLILLAVWLATRHFLPGYFVFGLVSGLMIWDDWLGLPYAAAAGTVLLAFRWRQLLGWATPILLAGVAVGLVPLIIHDVSAQPEDRLFSVMGALRGGETAAAAGANLVDYLHNGLLTSLPIAVGLCPTGECPVPVYGWLGALIPILMALSAVLAALAIIRLIRVRAGGAAGGGGETEENGETRPRAIIQAGRLALAFAGLLTIVLYVKSPTALLHPNESSRYLTCLLVSLPTAIWPLWRVASHAIATAMTTTTNTTGAPEPGTAATGPIRTTRHLARWGTVLTPVALVILAAVVLFSLDATFQALRQTADARKSDRAHQRLIGTLDALGVREIYTEYWVCNRIAFATTERITCATVSDTLGRGQDRILAYRQAVDAQTPATYVFIRDSAEGKAFQAYVDGLPEPVAHIDVAEYRIYRPSAPIDVPRK